MTNQNLPESYEFQPGRSKNIVVCCDGTWNHATQMDEGECAPTNVRRFFDAIETEGDAHGMPQLCWYDEGVGAELGWAGKLLSFLGRTMVSKIPGMEKLGPLIEGATGLGVAQNIREAYSWLSRVYSPGDRIFLLGFSRGALQVRSLSGLIHCVGLLRSSAHNYAPLAFAKYRDHCRKTRRAPADRDARIQLDKDEEKLFHRRGDECGVGGLQIHFLGVWDTVAGLGLPMWGWSFELYRFRTNYHSSAAVPIIVHAYHAVAMDEHRSSFMPVLMHNPGKIPHFEQVWFRGAHADVGGGYRRRGLSDIALGWMLEKAEGAELTFKRNTLETLKPDVLGELHDEAASNPLYAMLGLWPRMFPVEGINEGRTLGAWHESVHKRLNRMHDPFAQKQTDRYLGRQLSANQFKDDSALWDRPWRDPRECRWTVHDQKGEVMRCTVYAERPWSPTGLVLRKGLIYRVTVVNESRLDPSGIDSDTWFDLGDATSADGKSSLRTLWDSVRRASKLAVLWAWLFSPRFWLATAKRYPSACWFQLIGMINEPNAWERRIMPASRFLWYLLVRDPQELLERQIALGADRVFRARHSGPFYCYANDLWLTTGNNAGALSLQVRCLGETSEEAASPSASDRAASQSSAPRRWQAPIELVTIGMFYVVQALLAALVVVAGIGAAAVFGKHVVLAAWSGTITANDCLSPTGSIVPCHGMLAVFQWLAGYGTYVGNALRTFYTKHEVLASTLGIGVLLLLVQRVLTFLSDTTAVAKSGQTARHLPGRD